MGSIWLTDLADQLRAHGPPGPIREMPDWKTRGNGAFRGYERLAGICIHHDASTGSADPTGQRSAYAQCYTDNERPNAALHVAWDGGVWVLAAGATNTQGAGGGLFGLPVDTSGPYVGNGNVIGIEQGNNGVGEPYPAAQQNSTLWLCQVLPAIYGPRYGLQLGDVCSHFEWRGALGGKNDPAGPCRWNDNRNVRWDMNRFRADVLKGDSMSAADVQALKDFMQSDAYLDVVSAHVIADLQVSRWTIPHSGGPATEEQFEAVLGYLARNVAELVLALPTGIAKPLLDRISQVTTDVNTHIDDAVSGIVVPTPPPPDMTKVVGHQVAQGDITFENLP